MKEKAKILVVEDEAIIAKDLQWRLQRMGYEVPFVVATGKDALTKCMENAFDLILMDIMLRGPVDGIEAAEQIHTKTDVPVVYLTAYADDEILQRAKITEPFGYLLKPVDDRELYSTLEISLYKHRLGKQLKKEIDERRKTEELLLRTTNEWEETFNNITDMITIHDKDFNIIRANKAAKEMLKLPLLPAQAKCFAYYHGTEAPPDECPSCKCLKTLKPTVFEMYEPHLKTYVEIRAIPRFDKNNQLLGLIHIVRDIAGRKAIENELTKAKMEWEMIFDNAMEMILLVDKEFKITRCNKSFAEFTQKTADEIVGRKYTEFIPLDTASCGQGVPATRIEKKTDAGKWLYLSCCPIINEKNELLHAIIAATDITALKDTQQRLIESEKELKNRVKELEDFYEMAVGRELRIKDLKNQIAKLTKRLAQDKEERSDEVRK